MERGELAILNSLIRGVGDGYYKRFSFTLFFRARCQEHGGNWCSWLPRPWQLYRGGNWCRRCPERATVGSHFG